MTWTKEFMKLPTEMGDKELDITANKLMDMISEIIKEARKRR